MYIVATHSVPLCYSNRCDREQWKSSTYSEVWF